MKSIKEIQDESRRKDILEIKRILPYLTEVNRCLSSISASLRPDSDDNNQYSHWVYEIKVQLDFIASALTNEYGKRFGGVCQDGHIFRLKHLYEDSLKLSNKSIQERLVLELLINVCTAIIIANGNGSEESDALSNIQADFALGNTRKFINHLVKEHQINNSCREKNVWFSIVGSNYINSQE
jgi:hypothetical protein